MGLINSVREPGGNITGVRFPGVNITVKRFEVLREIAPQAKRIWLPYQRGYPIVTPQLEALAPLAKAAGVTLIEFPANNPAEIQAELNTRSTADDIGMDAIMYLVEPLTSFPDAGAAISGFAYEHKIPFGGSVISADNSSEIFSVNADRLKSGRLAAPLVNKVLKGMQAGTIPVVTPENSIEINFKAAQEFGLTVPDSLLKQASKIIR